MKKGISWLLLVDAGCLLAVHSAVITQVPAVTARRPTTGESATGNEWDFLRTTHWMPVESGAELLRLGEHRSSLLPRMDAARCVRHALEADAATLRFPTGHRLAMAKSRQRSNQSAAGRGEKLGKTPLIVVSWGSSGRF